LGTSRNFDEETVMPDHRAPAHSPLTGTPLSRTAPPRSLTRKGAVMLALAAALVAALTATMVRSPASEAASKPPAVEGAAHVQAAQADDVTWSPGDVSWEYLPEKNQCITTQDATVTTSTPDQTTQLAEVLRQEGHKTDFPAETGILDAHTNVVDAQGTTIAMVIHSYVTNDKCQAAVTPTDTGAAQGNTSEALGGTFRATADNWALGGVTALFAAVMYASTSAIAAASITAVAAGAGATVSTAVVAVAAGCIGGAASGALASLLYQSSAQPAVDWKSTLTTAASGCVGGALISTFPAREIAAATAESLEGVFGGAASSLVGTSGVRAGTSAGVEMTGITEVVSTTTGALRAVR
jgi:hypothetical protein